MLKMARLAVLPVLVLLLAGCTTPKTVAVAESSAATPVTDTPSSTPTPTGTPITTKKAADIYLDAVCPSNAADIQLNRSLAAYPVDISAVHHAAAKAYTATDASSKSLSDQTVLWPDSTEQDRYAVAGDEQELAKYYQLIQYADEGTISGMTEPSGSDASTTVRQALNIDGDRILSCVGHGYEAAFPKGYPKVVKVSSLPAQPRSWLQDKAKKAVALAPGVWATLDPGAEVTDAINGGTADGFCGSVKAYERKYLYGNSLGGACW